MRILQANAQHIGARHSQQDSFGFADPGDVEFLAHGGFLAVVCDGMGGLEHGDAASRTAVRAFLDSYRRKTTVETIPAALERSAFEANAQVLALAQRMGLVENIGTTLLAAVLHGSSLYFISVGDSGLFLVDGGSVRMLNRPHVFANLLDQAVARGSIPREEADRHPERDSLTSYIGGETLEEIDHNLEPWPLGPGDTILLATDGMFKTLAAEEIGACLEGPPQSWPETLVERTLAKRREYQDNITVLSLTLAREIRAESAPSGSMRPETAAGVAPPPPPVNIAPPDVLPAPVPPPYGAAAPVSGSAVDSLAPSPPRLPPPPPPPPPAQAAVPSMPPAQEIPQSPQAGSSHIGLWIALLLLLAAVAGGAWWYLR
jgi:serine/threonine protein phosphatase PrpC